MLAARRPIGFQTGLLGRHEQVTNDLWRSPTDRIHVFLHMARPVPELPTYTQAFYLAEGGANVVYNIILPAMIPKESEQQYTGKLLRLRKLIDSGTPYQETMRNFESQIRPLFRDNELVDQVLVRLPKGFIIYCNEQLRIDEIHGQRPKNRHGGYLAPTEPFGLLITDMTPAPQSGACLWEFKPKWLLQSPSAPANAKRCRTCALREMKNYEARKTGKREHRSFCSLDLVSDNFEDVLRATRFMQGSHGRFKVARFLYRNSTLLKLQECQRKMNAVGLLGLHAHFLERATSMTLRDCTMFVKVNDINVSVLRMSHSPRKQKQDQGEAAKPLN